jgi:D-galactonate transporter
MSALAASQITTIPVDRSEDDAIYRKINWRIVPIILFAYILAFLDRINVGFTQLQMKQDLGFSEGVFGLGAGLFFITYLMFEVPSNLWLEKIGARLTFLRIMVLWGLTSAAMMFVSEPWHFYGLRLLLGLFEAGFFPGVILYLTYWYPSSRRARVTGLFLFGMPITGVIGGPIATTIMAGMNGYLGYKGWQWVFLLEGLPTVLVGFLLFKMLPDKPHVAPWLSEYEKNIVEGALAADRKGQTGDDHHGMLKAALADPKTWILAFVYFTIAAGVYTLTFWLPTMVKAFPDISIAQVGWYVVPPFACGALGILAITNLSDRLRERRWHVALPMIVGTLCLFATTYLQVPGEAGKLVPDFWPTMSLLCIASFLIFGGGVLFWSIPPTYLTAKAAATGIAVISSIGILGGFVSPTLIGFVKDFTGSMTTGLAFMTGLAILGALVTLFVIPASAVRVGGKALGAADH